MVSGLYVRAGFLLYICWVMASESGELQGVIFHSLRLVADVPWTVMKHLVCKEMAIFVIVH